MKSRGNWDLHRGRAPSQGMYPVVREDAAQMAALQMQAEHGPALAGDPDGFEDALGKVVTKQVGRLLTKVSQKWGRPWLRCDCRPLEVLYQIAASARPGSLRLPD